MGKILKCISPVDGSVFAQRPIASDSEIAQVVSAARKAQAEWRQVSIRERERYCSAVVDAMISMKDEIVPELAWQMGRPVRFGGGELRGFEERARYMISIAEEALADVVPPPETGLTRYIRREPVGLVFVIAPWNYPYLTAVNSVIPALMAGNAVFLKHASQTMLVGERFQTACLRAGLPEGLFCNLVLSHEQTARILEEGLVDRVNFTGSVASGRTVQQSAAATFGGIGLELGGKDPAYVRADADIEYTASQLVDGAFFNSGQSCCGVERIYADMRVYEEFLDAFVARARGFVLGDPLVEETTLGPMVSSAAADFVRQQIRDAVAAGARALIDPREFEREAPGSAYMAPQVVVDVDHSMSIMRDESFGPVVGIMSVSDDEQTIRLMNDSPFGLTASIWTNDLDAAETIGRQIETGTVYMNRCDYLDPALAWTGVKDTGRGATLSRVGYENMTRPKSFYLRKIP